MCVCVCVCVAKKAEYSCSTIEVDSGRVGSAEEKGEGRKGDEREGETGKRGDPLCWVELLCAGV